MSDSVVRAAIEVSADTPAMPLTAQRDADARQAERIGEAAKAEATGVREAAVERTAGQRSTSMMWETTQKNLALWVIAGFMLAHFLVVIAAAVILVAYWREISKWPVGMAVLVALLTGALGAIASLASLVIGFYFSRTNHSRVGGVGGDEVVGVR